MNDDLPALLAACAHTIGSQYAPAGYELSALLPCEPAVGEVVVACFEPSSEQGSEGPEGAERADGVDAMYALHRLDAEAAPINDQRALREALLLLALVEAIEEHAMFDEIHTTREALAAWQPTAAAPDPRLVTERDDSLAALDAVAALDLSGVPRVARTQRLDELGGALRSLAARWEQLEESAAGWSDAVLAAAQGDAEATTAAQHDVSSLWGVLGRARRGPLAAPVSDAMHAGRQAGAALADAVLS